MEEQSAENEKEGSSLGNCLLSFDIWGDRVAGLLVLVTHLLFKLAVLVLANLFPAFLDYAAHWLLGLLADRGGTIARGRRAVKG